MQQCLDGNLVVLYLDELDEYKEEYEDSLACTLNNDSGTIFILERLSKFWDIIC